VVKFLFVYRRRSNPSAPMPPEEMQQLLQKWRAWINEGLRQGWILDEGDGVSQEGRVVSAKVVTDGPFVEAKEMVGGFSLIQAESIDAAVQLARGCPGLQHGGTVEVRPLAGYTTKS
jgi:hypothetical protein